MVTSNLGKLEMLEKYYNLYLPLNQKNERMVCSVFQTLVAVETTQKKVKYTGKTWQE